MVVTHVSMRTSTFIALRLFSAIGCSDLAPPSDDAYLKRVDDQITIRCYMTRQSWQLNCINGVWTGTVGVCSSINEDEGLKHCMSFPNIENRNTFRLICIGLILPQSFCTKVPVCSWINHWGWSWFFYKQPLSFQR